MRLLDLTVDEVLTTTRNVRKRLDLTKPVERAVVEECIDIAVQAPNGSNKQTWEWIAVDDPGLRGQLADLHRESLAAYLDILSPPTKVDELASGRNQRFDQINESVTYLVDHLQEVPVLLVPILHTPVRPERMGHNFYLSSIYGSILQAVWSFMLALRARGLGSAWTTLQLWRERETAEVLGIPYETYTQVGLFPVAHTVGSRFRPAQRVPASAVLHWNKFAFTQ